MTDGPIPLKRTHHAEDAIPLKMPSTPHRWGQDGLSSFWEAGRNNQFGTFVKKRPIFDKLVGIDNATDKSGQTGHLSGHVLEEYWPADGRTKMDNPLKRVVLCPACPDTWPVACVI